MTDLFLKDFRDLSSRNLAQLLFDEKTKIFGEQRAPAKERGVHRSCFSSSVGHLLSSEKARRENGEK